MFTFRPHTAVSLFLLGSLLAAGPVLAGDRVVREYSFDLSAIREIEFHASVGSLRIEPAAGDEVELVLDIEGKDGGWFRGNKDVSGVELKSEVRGERLILEQTEDNTSTQWTVRLPAVAMTTIEMGVGEIDAEFAATALNIELGVGEVKISAPRASAGRIDLSVGVGDASLRGAANVEAQRAIVAQEVRGEGDGDLDIEVETGVGDIELDLF